MERVKQVFLVGVVAVIGATIMLALTVYPFQYGFVESTLLAGGFVLFSVFKFVLDDATF